MDEIIGVIDLATPHDLIKEAVGKLNMKRPGICDIKVKGNEGYIPHIHIENRRGFECCICLLQCLYFTHKEKESKLDADQKVIFDTFMRSPNSKDDSLTNWQYALNLWVMQNDQSRTKLDNFKKNNNITNEIQPDYTLLDNGPKGTIHEKK
jgi:hypothetical protein